MDVIFFSCPGANSEAPLHGMQVPIGIFEKCLVGLTAILREVWNAAQNRVLLNLLSVDECC